MLSPNVWVGGDRARGTGGTLSPDHAGDPVGMQAAVKFHATIDAPVVADDHRPLGADVVEQADDVAGTAR